MTPRGQRFSILTLLGTIALAGCGGAGEDPNRPTTYPVTGIVTLNGSPVEGAQITFYSEAGGDAAQGAFGRTDAEGRYSLTSFDPGDGAVAGSYIVTVAKYSSSPESSAPLTESDPNYIPPGAPGYKEPEPPKNELPTKYSAVQTTDLRATVKEGENKIPLELTDA